MALLLTAEQIRQAKSRSARSASEGLARSPPFRRSGRPGAGPSPEPAGRPRPGGGRTPSGSGRIGADRLAQLHQAHTVAPRGLGGEPLEGVGLEAGRHDAFEEPAGRGHLLGRGAIDGPVQPDDAAEGAHRVALIGPFEGRGQVARLGGPAGVVVLEHHRRRLPEQAHEADGAVQVEQVVVRKLLAVPHLRRGQVRARGVRLHVKGGPLVGFSP